MYVHYIYRRVNVGFYSLSLPVCALMCGYDMYYTFCPNLQPEQSYIFMFRALCFYVSLTYFVLVEFCPFRVIYTSYIQDTQQEDLVIDCIYTLYYRLYLLNVSRSKNVKQYDFCSNVRFFCIFIRLFMYIYAKVRYFRVYNVYLLYIYAYIGEI